MQLKLPYRTIAKPTRTILANPPRTGKSSRSPFVRKSICVAVALLGLSLGARANILDDLFQWAAQQPATNTTTVKFAMTGNEVTRNNLVSYAVGTLYYHPPSFFRTVYFPASFSSQANDITQYFSDRTWSPPGSFLSYSFNPANTDPLTVTISRKSSLLNLNYYIDLVSSKWGFNFSFTPSFDANTKILYGSIGGSFPSFLTVSLGDQQSQPPQPPPQ